MASERVCIRSLRTQMHNNMVCSESGHHFLPNISIATIFTLPAIEKAILELKCRPDERIGLAKKIHHKGKKIFAILILMSEEDYIVQFRNWSALDDRLPLSKYDAQKIAGEAGSCLADEYQWKLLPEAFPLNMWEHHLEFVKETILPFVDEPEHVATGGFGEISKVKILASQQALCTQEVRQ
jgi:hypothetical protein